MPLQLQFDMHTIAMVLFIVLRSSAIFLISVVCALPLFYLLITLQQFYTGKVNHCSQIPDFERIQQPAWKSFTWYWYLLTVGICGVFVNYLTVQMWRSGLWRSPGLTSTICPLLVVVVAFMVRFTMYLRGIMDDNILHSEDITAEQQDDEKNPKRHNNEDDVPELETGKRTDVQSPVHYVDEANHTVG